MKSAFSSLSSGDTPLPNTVRSLPYRVRSPRQRSTRLSYQNTNDNGINDDKFWLKFQDYLLTIHNRHTAKARLLYTKKYYHVLTQANAQELLTLSNDKRMHAMKAMAALSIYLGCYDLWKDIIERYQLKWSNEDAVQAFQNIANTDHDFSSMVKCSKMHLQSYRNHMEIFFYLIDTMEIIIITTIYANESSYILVVLMKYVVKALKAE